MIPSALKFTRGCIVLFAVALLYGCTHWKDSEVDVDDKIGQDADAAAEQKAEEVNY